VLWLCAASSALIRLADKAPLDDAPLEELVLDVELELLVVKSLPTSNNEAFALFDAAVEDFDEVSDCNSPRADEAAARAGSITRLLDRPQGGIPFPDQAQQAACHGKSLGKTTRFPAAPARHRGKTCRQRQIVPGQARSDCSGVRLRVTREVLSLAAR
jgi:hypothetical protein